MTTPADTSSGRRPKPVQDLDDAADLAQHFRVDAIRMSTAAGSGHPTSSLSAADLIAVLAARHLKYDRQRPSDPRNDHLVFSNGHASPLLYALAVRSMPGSGDPHELVHQAGLSAAHLVAAAQRLLKATDPD